MSPFSSCKNKDTTSMFLAFWYVSQSTPRCFKTQLVALQWTRLCFQDWFSALDPGHSRAPGNWPPLSSLGLQALWPYHSVSSRRFPPFVEKVELESRYSFFCQHDNKGTLPCFWCQLRPEDSAMETDFFSVDLRDIFASLGQFLAISSF